MSMGEASFCLLPVGGLGSGELCLFAILYDMDVLWMMMRWARKDARNSSQDDLLMFQRRLQTPTATRNCRLTIYGLGSNFSFLTSFAHHLLNLTCFPVTSEVVVEDEDIDTVRV